MNRLRLHAPQGPGIAEPEDDISLSQDAAAPAATPRHRLVRGQWWKLSRQPGAGRGWTPEITTPTVSSSRSLPPLLAHNSSSDHPAAEPDQGKSPCVSSGCASPRTGPTPDPLTGVISIPGGNGHGCLNHSRPTRSIAVAEWIWSVGEHTTETHWETTMHHRDDEPARGRSAGSGRIAGRSAGPLADRSGGSSCRRTPGSPIPKSGRSWHLWQSEKARFSGL